MPGRASTRALCTSSGALTTTVTSTRVWASGLEQQRDLEHGELGALLLLLAQEIDLGLHHHRMHDGFELFQPARASRPSLARAAPGRPCRRARRRERRLRSPAPPRPHRAGAPRRRRRTPARRARAKCAAAVDLPMPIEPVRPMTSITCPKVCRDMGAKLWRHLRAHAEPALEARHRLVQQHAEPIDGRGFRVPWRRPEAAFRAGYRRCRRRSRRREARQGRCRAAACPSCRGSWR